MARHVLPKAQTKCVHDSSPSTHLNPPRAVSTICRTRLLIGNDVSQTVRHLAVKTNIARQHRAWIIARQVWCAAKRRARNKVSFEDAIRIWGIIVSVRSVRPTPCKTKTKIKPRPSSTMQGGWAIVPATPPISQAPSHQSLDEQSHLPSPNRHRRGLLFL
jgi:hypothetical protein